MLPGIGIFGCGKLVHFLVPCLREKGFKVEAIWGFNDEIAEATSKQLMIPYFTSAIDVLLLKKEVQLIIICCPPHIHSQIVSKSFSIGKHVLCDWPTALDLADIRKMVKAATYYPSLISVLCHPLRFIRTFQLMRTLITAENYVGDVNIVNASITGSHLLDLGDRYSVKCDQYMGGGLLTNIGSHLIDIISFVTDLKAKSVHGILRTYSPNCCSNAAIRRVTVDDFCNFQMELESNDYRSPCAMAFVTINNHLIGKFNYEITVCGSKGFLAIRGDNLYGCKYQPTNSNNKSLQKEENNEELLLQDDEQVVNVNSTITLSIPKPYTHGMVKLIDALKDAFSNNNDSPNHKSLRNSDSEKRLSRNDDIITHWFKDAVNVAANFEDGEYIQAVIDALKTSSRNKQWVRVEYKLPFEAPELRNCFSRKINGVK